jgi:hypothetical protein
MIVNMNDIEISIRLRGKNRIVLRVLFTRKQYIFATYYQEIIE